MHAVGAAKELGESSKQVVVEILSSSACGFSCPPGITCKAAGLAFSEVGRSALSGLFVPEVNLP